MSVYSSDPFVWEKEQAGRHSWARDRLVSGARSLRICLWFGPLPPVSVCLQGGICKYTASTAVYWSGVSLPASMRKHVYGEVDINVYQVLST